MEPVPVYDDPLKVEERLLLLRLGRIILEHGRLRAVRWLHSCTIFLRDEAMRVDYRIKGNYDAYGSIIKHYTRYLEGKGCRPTTVDHYVGCTKRYITFCQILEPTTSDLERFREHLLDKHLSRSTLNNYAFALENFHNMLGDQVKLPHLKRVRLRGFGTRRIN